MNEILSVAHLSVEATHNDHRKKIVRDISFSIQRGEIFSIVGESGSGKTTLACALTKLFSFSTMYVQGNVIFSGEDIALLANEKLRSLLRSEIRYLFQEPGQSLNPIARISEQIQHAFLQSSNAKEKFISLLSSLGLSNHRALLTMYPHQLSIGTLQRILLAMALAPQPKLLIADEPTSAVDSALKFQMMELLRTISAEEGMSVLFITHDLALAKRYADRIAVLYDGHIIEMNTSAEYFSAPAHPYSQLVLEYYQSAGKSIESFSTLNDSMHAQQTSEIGCPFYTRCVKAMPECAVREPFLQQISTSGYVRCPYWK